MRSSVVSLLAACHIAASVASAAETSPFLGNTLRGVVAVTSTRCDLRSGACSVVYQGTMRPHLYVSSEGHVFDYNHEAGGSVFQLGKVVSAGQQKVVMSLRGRTLTLHRELPGTLGMLTLDWIYTPAGDGKCGMATREAMAGYKFFNALTVESCEILPGHVE